MDVFESRDRMTRDSWREQTSRMGVSAATFQEAEKYLQDFPRDSMNQPTSVTLTAYPLTPDPQRMLESDARRVVRAALTAAGYSYRDGYWKRERFIARGFLSEAGEGKIEICIDDETRLNLSKLLPDIHS